MDYTGLVKRSWQITWRYKALWVLGIFAGVTGCQGGGGGNSGGSGGSGSKNGTPNISQAEIQHVLATMRDMMPLIIAGVVFLIALGVAWSILSIAARGGLVSGVNDLEQGRESSLRTWWSAGFDRFWSLVGVDVLLALPIFAVFMLVMVMIVVPLIGVAMSSGQPGPEVFAPVCGSLAIGVPLLIVLGFVLGIMHPLATRYVMLGGQGTMEAVGNSWRFFRARFKDTALLWIINGALNIAASMVVAVPAVIIGIGAAIGVVGLVVGKQWGLLTAAVGVLVFIFWALGLVYSGVWGTFTSSLWTLFFREATGMVAPAVATAGVPEPALGVAYPPVYPPPAPEGFAPASAPEPLSYPPAPPAPPQAPLAPPQEPPSA